jgi:signal peptidase II
VIDSTFYGVLLNNAPEGSATPWFHGQVIDMLYFPLFRGYFPDWMPMIGGDYFLFFSPVFNIADSSIFIGVVIILIMQKRFFKETAVVQVVESEASAEQEATEETVLTIQEERAQEEERE